MAANDIRVYSGPGGPHARIQHVRRNASETFLRGEPVAINADGELTESADDPLAPDLFGIAQEPKSASTLNWRTNAAYTTGDMTPVVVPDLTTYFVTDNYSSGGSAFDDVVPSAANVGDEAGLTVLSGVWGIDISATNNTCRIIDVLNGQGRSVQETGETLTLQSAGGRYSIVFQIVAHQGVPAGAADSSMAEAPEA